MQDEFSKVLPADLLRDCSAVRPPADRVTCLLIGNHSAGKSSFVNFYVGEEIQSTSVAMETAGITVVRSGKKRVEWRGRQTASAFPHLERVVALPGVLEHIETQFSTSSARDFRMVEFIDTPGLVDGTVKYPFDVDAAVDALAEHAAVVLVFLDPIGKALVARTMRAVQRLSKKHLAKMHFVLAKFDTSHHVPPRHHTEMDGIVVSDKMEKTINVAVTRFRVVPKYNKRQRYTRKFMAHDEEEECRMGDRVRIKMSRPISKKK